jgi:hypothetical protein
VAVLLLSFRRRRRAVVPVPTSQQQQEPRRTTSRSAMRRPSQSRVNAHTITPVRPPGTATAPYHYATSSTSSTSPTYDSPSSPLQSGFSKYSTQPSANSYVQPMESFYS